MSTSNSQILRSLSEAEIEVLGERVFCDAEMGIAWQRIEALPDEAVLSRIDARNEAVLRALAMFEEHDETQSDDAERAEFHRLDGKLNLALEMLAELVRQRQENVEAIAVRFNASGICWDASGPVPERGLLAVECYPTLAWPVPLRLHVSVAGSHPVGDGTRICARILELGPGARQWLDKLVFRRHRRAVAQQRTRG